MPYKIAIVLGLTVLLIGVALVRPGDPQVAEAQQIAVKNVSQVEPIVVRQPARLKIAAIGVDAPIIPVGVTSAGYMEAPKDLMDVGWRRLGPPPGSPGNAVLAGHRGVGGQQAVFKELSALQQGDLIEIVDVSGKSLQFKVTGMQSFVTEEAPLERIFGKADQPQLNLITCDGLWDEARKIYTKRLVVFTIKVS